MTPVSSRPRPRGGRSLFNREHQEFNPVLLQNLDVGEAYFHGGRLFVDPDAFTFSNRKAARKQSRRHYGRPREDIEPLITNALLSLTKPNPNKAIKRSRNKHS
jgi:hypothetical protein